MAVTKEESARDYLKKHKVMELFENMTSQMIFDRPENPREYMWKYMEKLRDSRTAQMNYPCIFDDSNVKSVFGMLDVTGKGYITYDQYVQALQTLGVTKYDSSPPGADDNRITLETFSKEAKLGLAHASATFAST